MNYRNKKTAFALSLLLILSQWLSLAHATEHSIDSGDAYCQICTLQHHFHSTVVDVSPCTSTVSTSSYMPDTGTLFQSTHTDSTRAIRAPPQ